MKNKKPVIFGVALTLFLMATVLVSYDENQYDLVSKINLLLSLFSESLIRYFTKNGFESITGNRFKIIELCNGAK